MIEGKYKAYPEYRDSGVEWLGEIPKSWDFFSGKRLFSNRREPASPSDQQLAASQKYGVIPQKMMMAKEGAKVMLALKGTSSFRHVEENDFVISLRSFEGGVEFSSYVGCVSPAYTVLEPKPKVAPSFFKGLLKSPSFISALQSTTDSLRDGKAISYAQFGGIELPLPSKSEQIQIARFLDHETGKIDLLIEKQQELIALLKEKRQAVISHAVTKGLNPQAPLKDSGIEWLGEVPEHWKILKGSWLGNLFGSEAIPDESIQDTGEIPLIKVSSLSPDGFDLGALDFFVSPVRAKRLRTHANYVVFPKRGAAIFSNKVNIIEAPSVIDPNLMGWQLGSTVLPAFIAHLLKLRGLGDIADVSTVPQINNKHIEPILFAIPPIPEQHSILLHLEGSLQTFSELHSKAETQITLLQERRTALISAAVTGKIDVRDWEPSPEETP
ncbi:MAG: restriction endonuclease subunit S [Luteolibacter sp.]